MEQAGFVLKTGDGMLVAIAVLLQALFRRLTPKLLRADALEFDVVVATRAHYDHFDMPPDGWRKNQTAGGTGVRAALQSIGN